MKSNGLMGGPVFPKVSVIIPVYNVAPYLAGCLDSVLGQTFSDLEIICVEDGSSDRSPDILAAYARRDSRLRVVSQPHGGPARARNQALSLARGRVISFVDGDDFLSREALEKSLPHMTEDVDCVCFRAKVLTEAGRSAWERKVSYFHPPFRGAVDIDEAVIRRTNVHLWNKLFRREVMERNRITFPDGLFYQDFTFTTAYLLVSRRAFYLEDRLYTYRLRPNSTMALTRRASFDRAADHLAVVMRLFDFMKERQLLSGHETWLTEYLVKYFSLAWQYAPAESRKGICETAGQCLKELEADFQDKHAVMRTLLGEVAENRGRLKRFTASRWRRLGRRLGLVRLWGALG